jgi:transcriptional regulator with XRE-family HTH domain
MSDLAIGTERDNLTGLLGAAIRERRIALHMSQEELAIRSGLHRTLPFRRATRRANPSIKTIARIAQALQVPVVTLFEPTRSETSHDLRPI